MKNWIRPLVATVLCAGSANFAFADPINAQFTATDSFGRAANVHFHQAVGTLTVTLTNTSTGDVDVPVDVLTAVFFDFKQAYGAPNLTVGTATVGGGSKVIDYQNPSVTVFSAGANVGGEWAFRDGISGAPAGDRYGISSIGTSLFGPGDRFDTGSNLWAEESPNGLEYGIVGANDNLATGNGGVKNAGRFFIQHSVVFTLTGWTMISVADFKNVFSNVNFQYGTNTGEPNITPPEFVTVVPVPTGMALMGIAGLLMVAYTARKSIKPVKVA
jgi:hypothetical protein